MKRGLGDGRQTEFEWMGRAHDVHDYVGTGNAEHVFEAVKDLSLAEFFQVTSAVQQGTDKQAQMLLRRHVWKCDVLHCIRRKVPVVLRTLVLVTRMFGDMWMEELAPGKMPENNWIKFNPSLLQHSQKKLKMVQWY